MIKTEILKSKNIEVLNEMIEESLNNGYSLLGEISTFKKVERAGYDKDFNRVNRENTYFYVVVKKEYVAENAESELLELRNRAKFRTLCQYESFSKLAVFLCSDAIGCSRYGVLDEDNIHINDSKRDDDIKRISRETQMTEEDIIYFLKIAVISLAEKENMIYNPNNNRKK